MKARKVPPESTSKVFSSLYGPSSFSIWLGSTIKSRAVQWTLLANQKILMYIWWRVVTLGSVLAPAIAWPTASSGGRGCAASVRAIAGHPPSGLGVEDVYG